MSDFPILKDMIDTELVTQIADRIQLVHPDFAHEQFVTSVDTELHDLELKPRFGLIADKFHEFLPSHYPDAVQILVEILDSTKHEFEYTKDVGFRMLSIPTFVERYGTDHLDASMDAMYIITRYTSCEFAIRPFIMKYPDQTLEKLNIWVHDENEHVRRLVSEGTRPRLPWAPVLRDFVANPSPALDIISHLQDDESLYVRRSVANHLNDITKDHPERVLDTLETWQNDASEGTLWLINHALRTLVKKGDSRALALLGYGTSKVELLDLETSPKALLFGDSLSLSFKLKSTANKSQNLMIDYVMHFVKANGKTAPKVFKLKKTALEANETLMIEKSHSIRPINTRKYYSGQHRVEVQVNGEILGSVDFELIMPDHIVK
jgi:3-methyladenine DNA glycosylase AlkC